MNLIKPKAIIFDWDNTLVDTWDIIHAALGCTFIEFGKTPFTLEESKIYVHKSMKDSFPSIFGDAWQDAAKRFYVHYLDNHLTHLKSLDNTIDTLNILRENNIKMSVLSNKRGDILRKEVEHFGWTEYFVKVMGSLDAAEDKPSAVPAFEIMKCMEIDSPQDVWFIGDSIADMECAVNAGCVPIFYGANDGLYSYSADSHINLAKLFNLTHKS
ncbi:HAD-superfamily hydrolase [Candidatus Jidaibacter acanthamoeba]|uniref:phosphoglycolate phosphatase n=1 Tax=Candidatus Jidaibacter acanthamoebae TaxID=86105 RepID=A0A0C1QZF2_9RICK|nr:HAD hydrolase-like protein [Candidatus Jidaibacter acanthamoeba]KIE05410.1 HAD-superfamily hydrolase [Candidatus Jidaibacter acanthamoeba]